MSRIIIINFDTSCIARGIFYHIYYENDICQAYWRSVSAVYSSLCNKSNYIWRETILSRGLSLSALAAEMLFITHAYLAGGQRLTFSEQHFSGVYRRRRLSITFDWCVTKRYVSRVAGGQNISQKIKKETAREHKCRESSISVSVLFYSLKVGLVAAPFLIVPLNADRSQARDSCWCLVNIRETIVGNPKKPVTLDLAERRKPFRTHVVRLDWD